MMYRIEDFFKSYSLVLEVTNVEFKKGVRSSPTDFFLIGLNERRQWFDQDIFCFAGQPSSKDNMMQIRDPESESPKFVLNLEKCSAAGVHHVDLLMVLDLDEPQSLSNLMSISFRLKDHSGKELELKNLTLNSMSSDITVVMLSFIVQAESWKLSTRANTSDRDIIDFILNQYNGVEDEEGGFVPAHDSRPGRIVRLIGFQQAKKVATDEPRLVRGFPNQSTPSTMNESSPAPQPLPSGFMSTFKLKDDPTDQAEEMLSIGSEPSDQEDKSTGETDVSLDFLDDDSMDFLDEDSMSEDDEPLTSDHTEDATDDEMHANQENSDNQGTKSESHPLKDVDFSDIHLRNQEWTISKESLVLRREGEQLTFTQEHLIYDEGHIMKSPSKYAVFQSPEVLIGTVLFTE